MAFTKTRLETGTNTVETYINTNTEETFCMNGKLLTTNELKEITNFFTTKEPEALDKLLLRTKCRWKNQVQNCEKLIEARRGSIVNGNT